EAGEGAKRSEQETGSVSTHREIMPERRGESADRDDHRFGGSAFLVGARQPQPSRAAMGEVKVERILKIGWHLLWLRSVPWL
ncbi:MAG: hypothetical protein KBA72_06950, partial [Thermoanaerobaculia bacterium]|nr:hypothetical protein [Thermoanaerobaculia bacterium]